MYLPVVTHCNTALNDRSGCTASLDMRLIFSSRVSCRLRAWLHSCTCMPANVRSSKIYSLWSPRQILIQTSFNWSILVSDSRPRWTPFIINFVLCSLGRHSDRGFEPWTFRLAGGQHSQPRKVESSLKHEWLNIIYFHFMLKCTEFFESTC